MFTALASFLQAKSKQGEWLLRIDDIDTPRVEEGAADGIMRTLESHGLHWDGAVAYQSQRLETYQAALALLDESGWLYPCTCSRKTLSALPRLAGEKAVYPGSCRHAKRSRQQSHALRVLVRNAVVKTDDRLQGHQRWDLAKEFGDFIVLRRDKIVSYHLATVVDDGESDITEVLRGNDLLESTAPQLHLQHLLGLPGHGYLHVPVIVDRKGIKLSKQNLASPVDVREPSANLYKLLVLLNQLPPVELRGDRPENILAWAVRSWDVSKLTGLSSV